MIRGLLIAVTLLVCGTAYGQGEPLYTAEIAWDEALDQTVPATNEFVDLDSYSSALWPRYFGLMENQTLAMEEALTAGDNYKDEGSDKLDEANTHLDDGYSHIQLRDMAYDEGDYNTAASEDVLAREEFEDAKSDAIAARQFFIFAHDEYSEAETLIFAAENQ